MTRQVSCGFRLIWSLTSSCERAGYCFCFSISRAVNEPSVTVVYSSLAGLCIMGCGFTLTGERSRAPIRMLQLFVITNFVGGLLPHNFLCKVKHSLRFFVLLCLFRIFFDNKSMFHRLLLSLVRLIFHTALPVGLRSRLAAGKTDGPDTEICLRSKAG